MHVPHLALPLFLVACVPARSTGAGDDTGDDSGGRDDSGASPAPTWVDLEASAQATCARDSAGGVLCWGSAETSEATIPSGPYAQIAVGLGRACGLRGDGSVACWGMNDAYDALIPPAGTFDRLALADELGCVADREGGFTCWGRTDDVTLPTRTDAVAFDIAGIGVCELDAQGGILCSGLINPSASSAAQNPPADTYTSLNLGQAQACAVRAGDGSVACWGTREGPSTDGPEGSGYVQVVTGTGSACALDEVGGLWCGGEMAAYPDQLGLPGPFVDVALGATHLCALQEDGQIACLGSNGQGESTPPEATNAQDAG